MKILECFMFILCTTDKYVVLTVRLTYPFFIYRIVPEIKRCYKPNAVVLQCGADCLTKDPIGSFNLTSTSLGHCVKDVLTWNIPTLVLGGGKL